MGSTEGPAGAARALGPWHPQEFMAECVETVPEAGGMMTFVFRRCDGAPLAFRPGQYVNVAFPVNGEDQDPVDRSYSLSSSPTQAVDLRHHSQMRPHGPRLTVGARERQTRHRPRDARTGRGIPPA